MALATGVLHSNQPALMEHAPQTSPQPFSSGGSGSGSHLPGELPLTPGRGTQCVEGPWQMPIAHKRDPTAAVCHGLTPPPHAPAAAHTAPPHTRAHAHTAAPRHCASALPASAHVKVMCRWASVGSQTDGTCTGPAPQAPPCVRPIPDHRSLCKGGGRAAGQIGDQHAADTQTAHHAAFSTVPTRQLLGSANAETTPARAP
eukprot:CAMPEP_0174282294 /NCGR_PEP_ID=MMETSP0809-20121228/2779_1 /TAXON_ID=73025 ORGANISM="Eutreptiella gymnastica-like, Strain CCMP1594" /NCGR_SAMPLE_ID=MMETSP0809 /ASSEMBLY_ACC=CAM_ASM_000658 /LENGTH=200 /DNA_ID=CAMNT_0015376397 /DNA_START=85 /DNA_END=684 /DNA_ORIENTATION=+